MSLPEMPKTADTTLKNDATGTLSTRGAALDTQRIGLTADSSAAC
jgi:hypothetical protein